MRPDTWSPSELAEFDRVYATKSEPELLLHFPGKSAGQIRGRAISRQLTRPAEGVAFTLAADHPALFEHRTIFPSRVRRAGEAVRLLVHGRDQRKLGARVTRGGPWQGWPIYSLTLEERATCPRYCHHWRSCMGNAMQWSARIEVNDPDFMPALGIELEELQAVHPGGFVVRLHILGDFYAVEYVEAWSRWLDQFPALHAFGYTACDPARGSTIGAAVLDLAARRWDRFAIRLSTVTPGEAHAITLFEPDPAPQPGVIVCPAETGKTKGCGTCGLCWAAAAKPKTIAFIAHGGRRGRRKKK